MNHFRSIRVFSSRRADAAGRCVAAAAAAGVLAAAIPAQGVITMYEDSVYRGLAIPWPLALVPQNVPFPVPSGIEDEITSLRWTLDPGVRLTFFHDSDGDGPQFRIDANAARNSGTGNVGAFHNDRFSSFVWQRDTPGAGHVEVFDDSLMRGDSDYLPLGSYAENRVHRLYGTEDRVTSMRWSLPDDVVLTFFEHADGSGREFTVMHDQPRSGGISNVGSYYNDKFSSFAWRRVTPSAGWVQFFTDANHGGYQFTRYLSETGLTTVDVRGLGYNDQFDSVRWSLPADRTVMALDEAPAGGRALPLIDSGSIADFNSYASGLHHDRISTLQMLAGQLTAAYADRNAPLDEVCQLASHNAHSTTAQGWRFWYNQTMSVIEQLDYGARLLQLDVLEHTDGLVYLVHGSYRESVLQRNGSAPELLSPQLLAIYFWLVANPKEVVFLDFQNEAGRALDRELAASPLSPMITIPRGLRWPSTNELVAAGKRCVVVDDRAGTGVPYHYDWAVQNGYSDFQDTSPRIESEPIDGRHRSMFYMNHISGTVTPLTWVGGSPNTRGNLVRLANWFRQPPNFIGIDGIEMADHGGLEACRDVNRSTWPQYRRRARTAEFHAPCPSGRLATANDTLPRLGTTLVLSTPSASVVAIGTSDSSFQGVPLPAVMPGTACSLRVAPLVVLPAPGQLQVPILNSVDVIGLELLMQAVRLDGSLRLSNGLRVTCGL